MQLHMSWQGSEQHGGYNLISWWHKSCVQHAVGRLRSTMSMPTCRARAETTSGLLLWWWWWWWATGMQVGGPGLVQGPLSCSIVGFNACGPQPFRAGP